MLSHRVGNGELTSLWFDKWYPLGSLVDTFGERVIYDSALLKDSKVARVISNNSWVWPVARSGAFMAIRDKLTQLPPPNNSCDRAVWDSSPNGVFSTKHTWQYLYGSQSTVPWYTLVWFRGAFPRHSFLLWLAIQKRLPTHDRIHTFTPGPLACILCCRGMENHNHLFFNCTYSGYVWQD